MGRQAFKLRKAGITKGLEALKVPSKKDPRGYVKLNPDDIADALRFSRRAHTGMGGFVGAMPIPMSLAIDKKLRKKDA